VSKLIAICGPDRVGKATQTQLLVDHLKNLGHRACRVEVPVKGNMIYPIIYWMLRNGLAKKLPKTFQWLQYFNRQIFQWTTLPALQRDYDFIVFDRWSLSTLVYGAAEGVPLSFTLPLTRRLVHPDLTIVLTGQSHLHEPEDVYESDSQLQSIVRNLYSSWCHDSDDIVAVDADGGPVDVHKRILYQLKMAEISA